MSQHEAIYLAVAVAKDWLGGQSDRPVAARADIQTLRPRIRSKFSDKGTSAKDVIERLVAVSKGGFLGSEEGRFFT